MTDGMTAEERFLEDLKARRTKGTVKSYRRGLDLFLEYCDKNSDTVLAERKQDV
jgi:site-specific recombinase XerD